MSKKREVIRKYVFEQTIRESVWADNKEQAVAEINALWGTPHDFELVDVVEYRASK